MSYKIINGSISYGAETILEEINLEIEPKDKIAIVGRNGSGKTTLLKALIDNSMLEEGIGEEKFQIYKNNMTIGYLQQTNFEDMTCTMLDEILKVYAPIIQMEKKIEKLTKELETDTSEKLIKEYTESLEKYEFQGGYTYKKEYEVAIKKFGFTEQDKYKTIQQFSGGQQTKIAFLKLLLSKPDLLLLDEPTNHLDIVAIEWLENYLKNYPKAVVIVSHDRMFLNRIVNQVYEIEYASLTKYVGNYSDFEKQKQMNYEKRLKDYEYQQAEIKRLKAIADRFRYKPTKAKMALSKLKKIEQMTMVQEPKPSDLKTFHANYPITEESGKMVLSVKNLEIGYSTPITTTSFTLYKGQKLGIIGENGTGKSTLLKTLNGEISKLGGEVEYGYHVHRAYFEQQMQSLNEENTIFDEIYETFPELTTTQIRTLLGNFLFSGEDVFKKIKVLSGGEKSRLKLCKIFKSGANLLLLDEPTNHMDIVGKETLERILEKYEGTIIFVSHDRYLVNKIADSILEFQKGKTTFFQGNYEEYISLRQESIESDTKNEKIKIEKQNTNSYYQNKEKNKMKNKMLKIEEKIQEKEKQIKEIECKMKQEEISTDYIRITRIARANKSS